MDFFDGFAWAVPRAFADSLEKGRFERGDVFHADRADHDRPWSADRAAERRTLQVRRPEQGEGGRPGRDAASVFADNWRRSAEVLLRVPGETTPRTIATTQGRLYVCLWRDDVAGLETSSPEPALPLGARDLREDLDAAAERLAEGIDAPDGGGHVFVTLYDQASSLLRRKDRDLRDVVANHPGSRVIETRVDRENALPTLRWMVYVLPRLDADGVAALLKPALYRPQGDRTGKTDRFDLNRHGRLVAL